MQCPRLLHPVLHQVDALPAACPEMIRNCHTFPTFGQDITPKFPSKLPFLTLTMHKVQMLRKSLRLAQLPTVQARHHIVQSLPMRPFLNKSQYFPTVLTHSSACESLVSGEDVVHEVGACREVFQADSTLGGDGGDVHVFVVGEVEVGVVGGEALEYSVAELTVNLGVQLL